MEGDSIFWTHPGAYLTRLYLCPSCNMIVLGVLCSVYSLNEARIRQLRSRERGGGKTKRRPESEVPCKASKTTSETHRR